MLNPNSFSALSPVDDLLLVVLNEDGVGPASPSSVSTSSADIALVPAKKGRGRGRGRGAGPANKGGGPANKKAGGGPFSKQ